MEINMTKVMPTLTEELILNPDVLDCGWHEGVMKGWRRYRIEYGFECGCPEGTIYLPPDVDTDEFEGWIQKVCANAR